MKPIQRLLTMAATAALITLGAGQALAQRGGGDPEEFRTRMMERYREQLKVTSDDEWKIVETRINAVMEARRELGSVTPRGRFMGAPRGRGGDEGGQRGAGAGRDRPAGEGRRGAGGPGGPGFGGEPSPQLQALEQAIESNASADDVKTKLAALRAARKEKEAKLAAAQDNLKQVLAVNQEATAVLMGLLE